MQYLLFILSSLFVLRWLWKRFEKSESFLQLNIILSPKNAEKHFLLGYYLYDKNEKLDKAEKELRQAVALVNQDCRYVITLANILDINQKYAEAIDNYQRVIKLDTGKTYAETAYRNIGLIFHEKLNRFEEAEKAYRNAIELNSMNPESYFQLGWLLYDRLHRYADAEVLFLKTLELNPQDEIALYNMACIKSISRDSDSAFAYLRKAIEKGFDREWAKNDKDLEWLQNDPVFNEVVDLPSKAVIDTIDANAKQKNRLPRILVIFLTLLFFGTGSFLILILPIYILRSSFAIVTLTLTIALLIQEKRISYDSIWLLICSALFLASGVMGYIRYTVIIHLPIFELSQVVRPPQVSLGLFNIGLGLFLFLLELGLSKMPGAKIPKWLPLIVLCGGILFFVSGTASIVSGL